MLSHLANKNRIIKVIGQEPQSEQEFVDYIEKRLKAQLGSNKITYTGFKEKTLNYLFTFNQKTEKEEKQILVKIAKLSKSNPDIYLPGHWQKSGNSYDSIVYLDKIIPENSKIAVPAPILNFPELKGFAREWIAGDCLLDFMHLAERSASDEDHSKLKEQFRNIGEAIGILHTKTYDARGNISQKPTNQYITNLSNWFSRFKINPYTRSIRAALNFAKIQSATIDWDNVSTSWVHGDLIPANIILTKNNKISIIDMEHSKFDSPMYDVSWFMVRTLIDNGYRTHKYSTKYLNELNSQFLQGYLTEFKEDFNQQIFMLYSVLNILQCIYLEYTTSLAVFMRNTYSWILLKNYLNSNKTKAYH